MIRTLIMAVGFVGSTLVLVWGLGGLTETGPTTGPSEQVSRAAPDPLGLQPAMSPVVLPQSSLPVVRNQDPVAAPAPVPRTADPVAPSSFADSRTPAPVRPVARPATLVVPAPRPSAISAVQPSAVPAPQSAAIDPADKVNNALLVMGMGVVNELKKPVDRPPAPVGTAVAPPVVQPDAAARTDPALAAQAALAGAVASRAAAPPPAAAPAPVERVYTVQPGDSLPGIAFRVYGSTVGYLKILAANQDRLRDPSQLRAGMVLRIPDN